MPKKKEKRGTKNKEEIYLRVNNSTTSEESFFRALIKQLNKSITRAATNENRSAEISHPWGRQRIGRTSVCNFSRMGTVYTKNMYDQFPTALGEKALKIPFPSVLFFPSPSQAHC